MLTRNQAILC